MVLTTSSLKTQLCISHGRQKAGSHTALKGIFWFYASSLGLASASEYSLLDPAELHVLSCLASYSLLMSQCSSERTTPLIRKAAIESHHLYEDLYEKLLINGQQVCLPWEIGKLFFMDKMNHVTNSFPFLFGSQESQSHNWGITWAVTQDSLNFSLVF